LAPGRFSGGSLHPLAGGSKESAGCRSRLRSPRAGLRDPIEGGVRASPGTGAVSGHLRPGPAAGLRNRRDPQRGYPRDHGCGRGRHRSHPAFPGGIGAEPQEIPHVPLFRSARSGEPSLNHCSTSILRVRGAMASSPSYPWVPWVAPQGRVRHPPGLRELYRAPALPDSRHLRASFPRRPSSTPQDPVPPFRCYP